jgi:2-oxoglutarate ferredoxin oxidoreductase subunit gamma
VSRMELRITGFGGQGVILMGHIVGHAWAVNADKHATMLQSFGPEARGGACSTTLAMSDTEILYPYVKHLDILVAMSTEGYDLYRHELKDDGLLVYERDLVHPDLKDGQPAFAIPSTRIAESLGRTIVQNIVMLGFFAAVTKLVSREEMHEAVKASVPEGTEALNLKAFDAGWTYFEETYGQNEAGAAVVTEETTVAE